MPALSKPYSIFTLVAALLFFIFGWLAIIEANIIWLTIPFALALSPLFLHFITHYTKHLFWILLVLLPLSTEVNITPALGLDFPDEIFLWLLTAIGLIQFFHQPGLFYNANRSTLFLLIFLQLVWIAFTCFFSTEPLLSIKFLLAKIWFIVPFVLLTPVFLQHKNDFKQLGLCLSIPMMLVIAQTLIRHSFYGFEFAMIKKTLSPFFRNHVNYAAMLVCLLPIGWGIWKLSATQVQKNRIRICIIIALVALFFAYSRGAWLAAIGGLMAAWAIQKKWLLHLTVIAIIVATIFTCFLVNNNRYLQFAPEHDQTIFHSNFKDHLSATIQLKDISNAERFHRWVAGANMIATKPFTGFGPNSFYKQYTPFTVSAFKTWVSNNPEHSTVHNYFMLTAIEQGIPGLILLLLVWLYMLYAAQQLYHRFISEFYSTVALITGIIICMIAIINCTSDLIETDKIGSLFWLVGGVIIALQIKLKEETKAIASTLPGNSAIS